MRNALVAGVVVAVMLSTGCGQSTGSSSTAGTQASPEGNGRAGSLTQATTVLAAPARAYVDAVNAGDLDAVVDAFALDGKVIDVSREIRGRGEIRTWARNEVIGGRLEVRAITVTPGGQNLLVHWAPRGTAGFRAQYRFTMTDTAITVADLQYA